MGHIGSGDFQAEASGFNAGAAQVAPLCTALSLQQRQSTDDDDDDDDLMKAPAPSSRGLCTQVIAARWTLPVFPSLSRVTFCLPHWVSEAIFGAGDLVQEA